MRLLILAITVAALEGCSACSAVDEADLIPRRDTGVGLDSGSPRVDGAIPGVDGTVVRHDSGGGGGLGDPSDCGGVTCSDLELCLDNVCQCRAGRTRVDGHCVDLSSDPDHCGEPGRRCESGVCASGACRESCPDGTTQCGDACVRTWLDPANCGACGETCSREEFCNRGSCDAYRPGIGCTSCPCATCTGDFTTCCNVGVLPGAVACIDADRCPGS